MCSSNDHTSEKPSANLPPGRPARVNRHDSRVKDTCLELVSSAQVWSLSETLLKKNNISVFRVIGDSMSEDDVFDGDCVIVRAGSVPKDGDLVVAVMAAGNTTIKRFYRIGRGIRLEAANPSHGDTLLEEQNLVLQGVVVGILRKFGTSH